MKESSQNKQSRTFPQIVVHCSSCQAENKSHAKNCKKCGFDLTQPVLWGPDYKWHLKTLGIIYLGLILIYFIVSHLLLNAPEPYKLRDRPPEITPWLK